MQDDVSSFEATSLDEDGLVLYLVTLPDGKVREWQGPPNEGIEALGAFFQGPEAMRTFYRRWDPEVPE